MRHVRHARLRSWGESVRTFVPDRFEVPLRYWTMRSLGVLEPEVARLSDWVPRGGVSVDIGANFGPYTYALARMSSLVHAFEPNPLCAQALRAWNAGNVEIHEIALSDVAGEAHLEIPVVEGRPKATQGSIVTSGPGVLVRTRTLDEYRLPRVDFIKIDVEGHELAVIEGAVDTLERARPMVLMEIAARLLPKGTTVSDVVDAVTGLGYAGMLLTPRGDVDAELFDVDEHQPLSDGRRGPGYANMFLFRARQ